VRLVDGPSTTTFHEELNAFLDEHAPPEAPDWALGADAGDGIPGWGRAWQAALYDHGWLVPENPPGLGGRGATPDQLLVYLDELIARGLPRSLHFPGYAIVAPTLQQFGTAGQRRLVPPALRGDHVWCVGMSEPDAGSDLSGLRTRARTTDAGGYVVTGRKVWTSYAPWADRCLCYARTSSGSTRAGISALVIDMRASGVQVTPIRQLTGAADFAEVVFDEVEVPSDGLVGERDGGWQVALASLEHERRGLAVEWLAGNARITAALVDLAARDGELAMAEQVAAAHRRASALRAFALGELDLMARGRPGSPSLLKLVCSELTQHLFDLAVELLGEEVVVSPRTPDATGAIVGGMLRTLADTIGGGTSEIQRDVIARSLLPLGSGVL
jgi:alkylation response protein AidB-like acyl-CoA dehydrogenase